MDSTTEATLFELRKHLPPVFAGVELDRLTGNAYRWRTFCNERTRNEVPENIFLRSGKRKILINRDQFLKFWSKKLSAVV